jgi:hypothetical protein
MVSIPGTLTIYTITAEALGAIDALTCITTPLQAFANRQEPPLPEAVCQDLARPLLLLSAEYRDRPKATRKPGEDQPCR